jgi:hypothetical protein
MGRPSSFCEKTADFICEGLMDGKSMRQICDEPGMPNRSTVLRWMEERPDFASKCARARELQADLMDDLVLEEAKTCTNDNAQAARVRIAAYQWRAAKLAPKRYGDKIAVGGADDLPAVQQVTQIQLVALSRRDSGKD